MFLSLFAMSAHAQTIWQLKTPADSFNIEIISASKGRIDGKEVSLAPITKFTKVLNRRFVDGCPKLSPKAPIHITQTKGQDTKNWKLYVKEGIWSDGTHCLAVAGTGLNEFPLHRIWFDGNARTVIDLGAKFSITTGSDTVSFVNDRGVWTNEDPEFFTDWTMIETLVNTLNGFTVGVRTTERPDANAAQFTLRTGKKSYKFVRMGDDWAVNAENPKWTSISPDFRWLKEISKESLRSPNAQEIALLRKTDTPEEERLALLKKLAGNYNSDIKHTVQELVMSREESIEIKRQAAQIIKYHPTDESMIVLARALTKTEDPELLHAMTDALRVKNRQGPRISTTDQPSQIEKKVQEWQKWANELQAKLKK
jgi:hypothetical protein